MVPVQIPRRPPSRGPLRKFRDDCLTRLFTTHHGSLSKFALLPPLSSTPTRGPITTFPPAPANNSTSQPRTSQRYSTYSVAPSVTPTVGTTDSATAEMGDIQNNFNRMENKALSQQRVELSEKKTETLSKLALGAKVERALDRRMSSQDAVMRPRGKSTLNEKKG
ncbi:hypothetical protein IMZ48_45650 [Candidatus Bathyarchaeota archaeon]|nr:hypothetical protein [Candidatus Bathyarchaeota archaeon]